MEDTTFTSIEDRELEYMESLIEGEYTYISDGLEHYI